MFMEREFTGELGENIICKYDVDTDEIFVKNDKIDDNFHIITHIIDDVEEGIVIDIEDIIDWEDTWSEDIKNFIGNFYRENKVNI